jgi:hypothetical protein
MLKWIGRLVGVGIVGLAGFFVYEMYRAGSFDLPELPDGAYTISFENGLRAIVTDIEVADPMVPGSSRYFRSLSIANRDRKYLGIPLDVQPWFRDAWSWCKPPNDSEKAMLDQMPDDFKQSVGNARFEAVCKIDVDGTEIFRGLIFSVPNL